MRQAPLYSIVIALHPASSSSTDYRLGDLSIDWIDYDSEKQINEGDEREKGLLGAGAPTTRNGRSRSTSATSEGSSKSLPNQPMAGPSRHRTQGTTELGQGILHLFKHAPPLTLLETLEADMSKDNSMILEGASSSQAEGEDGTLVAILAVPGWMGVEDFVGWLGAWTTCLEGLRMLRDVQPNRTIALLKFREVQEATDFASITTGKPFLSEPTDRDQQRMETCHPLRIHHLVLHNLASPASQPTTPKRTTREIVPAERALCADLQPTVTPASLLSRIPARSITELPTCPVCLERMDNVISGLITTPCTHVFNCRCLDRWGDDDGACPVCRFSRRTEAVKARQPPPPCQQCERQEDDPSRNWVCILCGFIGCHRYSKGHARDHFFATGHSYAMEIDTQRVWDYIDDSYVHRLLQNPSDGKLVELPSAASLASHKPASFLPGDAAARAFAAAGPSLTDERKMSDIEKITFEYSAFLSAQLEEQKKLHDAEMRAVQRELKEARKKAVEGDSWRKRFVREEERFKSVETTIIPKFEAEKRQAEVRAAKVRRRRCQFRRRC